MVGVLNPRVIAALQKMLPYPRLPLIVQVADGQAQFTLYGQGWQFRASVPAEGALKPVYLPAGVLLTLLKHAEGGIWTLLPQSDGTLLIRTPNGSEYLIREVQATPNAQPGVPASPRRSLENLLRVLNSLGSARETAGAYEGWRRVSVNGYELEHSA